MTQYTRVPLRRERKNRRLTLPGWALGVIGGVILLPDFGTAVVLSWLSTFCTAACTSAAAMLSNAAARKSPLGCSSR